MCIHPARSNFSMPGMIEVNADPFKDFLLSMSSADGFAISTLPFMSKRRTGDGFNSAKSAMSFACFSASIRSVISCSSSSLVFCNSAVRSATSSIRRLRCLCNSFSISLRSVISRMIAVKKTPSFVSHFAIDSSSENSLPSFLNPENSNVLSL